MRFGILGPLEVADDEGRRLESGGLKRRAVLAILLLRANEVVSTDRLIEALWSGRPPASAAKSLQVHVSRLRRAFRDLEPEGEERLATQLTGYVLRVGPDELDGERFERLIAEGDALLEAGSLESAVGKLREALALWRGGPLSDFEYESFAQAEIARLSELQLTAVERLVEAELALGREGQMIAELEARVRKHPYRERLRGQLMLALYRTGRQADALEVYRDGRVLLDGELGIEPSAELRELHGAILTQDASLLRPTARRAAGAGAGLFVGYEPELEVMRAALERTFAGQGGVVLVGGEPGIGKSHLAERLDEIALARGARVLWGRCWEAGGAPPYWPWVQALSGYVRDLPVDQLRERVGAGGAELVQILPELREALPALGDGGLVDTENGRFRLFEAVAGLLRRAAASEALVIILDDLHAADETSRLLLRYLADVVVGSRVLVVGTYRDIELSDAHPLWATLGELDRHGGVARLALGGFGPDETARFLELSAAEHPMPALARAVHRSSGGNPLFVAELVRPEADARDAAAHAHQIAEHKGHVLFADRARSILTADVP
jgi:DNA-binding SARP family transcriptional activator